jgi:glycerol-3-phosphate dehydrogenase subunit C
MTITQLVAEASEASFLEIGLSADDCLKCNVCNTVCPVARVTDAFPGPKYVGPQAQRFRLATLLAPQGAGSARPASPDATVDWCSGCGLCTIACPADVKIAEMNSRARAQLKAGHRPRFRDWLLGQTDLVGRLGVLTWPIANWSLRNRLFRRLIEAFVGIHRRAPVPLFAHRTLGSRVKSLRPVVGSEPPPDRAVVLFHGCAANYYEPEVALAAIDVLRRNGLETIVPEQVCCGLPMISNGLYAGARGRAATNLRALADYARRGYRIVGTSTSCTHTLKAEYREMLDLDDADARAVSEATWDICELLVDMHDEGRLDTGFGEVEEALPYHAPCQLKGHGIGLPAMELFALVPGLTAIDLDHDCCGVAGTYGLKKEKYEIAMDVGAPLFAKVEAARDAGANRAVCDSETCRWQIAAATSTRVEHPIQVLAEAYMAADAARAASALASGPPSASSASTSAAS